MDIWLRNLKYNPITPLLECGNVAILTFVRRDFLDKTVSVEDLWQLAEPQKILKKQKPSGSWIYPSVKNSIRTQENYNQLETYRNLGILVEEFGFNKKHPAIAKSAEYLFSFQSNEGDFRGIYGNQYSPNYSAGITELLVKAGYGNDTHIQKVFEWLLSIRQKDTGWAIPFRTRNCNLDAIAKHSATIEPDKSKLFSYMVTGVVLRAFAAHPTYRKSKEAHQAGILLLSMVFKKDHYPDRAGAEYWLRFSFPFWFTDLISALDTLSLLGFSAQEPQIEKALQWFVKNQQKTGLWQFKILKGKNKDILELWLALAVCRIFKRFYS
jgi:Squalene-hopene cyclase C-terminal domain